MPVTGHLQVRGAMKNGVTSIEVSIGCDRSHSVLDIDLDAAEALAHSLLRLTQKMRIVDGLMVGLAHAYPDQDVLEETVRKLTNGNVEPPAVLTNTITGTEVIN